MAGNPPTLTTLMQSGFVPAFPVISDEPTHRDLGKLTLFIKAATEACASGNTAASAIDVGELGKLQDYARKLSVAIDRRATAATPPPGELLGTISAQLSDMQARLIHLEEDMQARLDRLEEAVEKAGTVAKSEFQTVRLELGNAKKDIQRESKKEFTKVTTDIEKFSTTFGRWSVPSAQKFNRECHFGTGLQAVAYPNGKFPEETTREKLSSIQGISDLTEAEVDKLALDYGRRRTDSRTPRAFLLETIGVPSHAAPAT